MSTHDDTNVHRSCHQQDTGNSKARRDGGERDAGQEAKIWVGFNPLVSGRKEGEISLLFRSKNPPPRKDHPFS